MKKSKIFTITLCAALFFSAVVGSGTAKAAVSPNRVVTKVVSANKFSGTVSCQPSYVDNGRHAVRGYFNWDGYDKTGKRVGGTSKVYTSKGKGPTDSTVYTATKDYTAKSNVVMVLAPVGFDWVADGSGAWPYGNIDSTVTE